MGLADDEEERLECSEEDTCADEQECWISTRDIWQRPVLKASGVLQ